MSEVSDVRAAPAPSAPSADEECPEGVEASVKTKTSVTSEAVDVSPVSDSRSGLVDVGKGGLVLGFRGSSVDPSGVSTDFVDHL